jgi:hypothetical protein
MAPLLCHKCGFCDAMARRSILELPKADSPLPAALSAGLRLEKVLGDGHLQKLPNRWFLLRAEMSP